MLTQSFSLHKENHSSHAITIKQKSVDPQTTSVNNRGKRKKPKLIFKQQENRSSPHQETNQQGDADETEN